MKRYDTPLLGSNGGATVRMEGPQAPLAVFHPASELERIRNPFLPPEGGPEDVVEAEFEGTRPDREVFDGRASVWSLDTIATIARHMPKTPPSGRMIAGSLVVLAVLGAGGFAALYSAVHSDDASNRAHYAAEESRDTTPAENESSAAPTVPAPVVPVAPEMPASPAPAPVMSSAALGTTAAGQIDSGTAAHPAVSVAVSAPIEPRRAFAAPPQAALPARLEAAPARKTPIVVHIEPAPVPRHDIEDKDVPISEDALLAGSAHAAQPPPPSTEANGALAPKATDLSPAPANAAPSNAAPSNAAPSNTAPSNTAPPSTAPAAPSANPDPIPPSTDNPDDPRK